MALVVRDGGGERVLMKREKRKEEDREGRKREVVADAGSPA